MSIPAKMGRFVGRKADILDGHIIGSSVSGLIQDARIVFLYLYSSIYFCVNVAIPFESALSEYNEVTSL